MKTHRTMPRGKRATMATRATRATRSGGSAAGVAGKTSLKRSRKSGGRGGGGGGRASKRAKENTRGSGGGKSAGGKSAGLEARYRKAEGMPPCGAGDRTWSIADGMRHLVACDERWGPIISAHDVPTTFCAGYNGSGESPYFHSLLKTIIHQQLGIKAAKTIEGRVMTALKLKPGAFATPAAVSRAKWSTRSEGGKQKVTLNGAVPGLSHQKAAYIQSLAASFSSGGGLCGVNLDSLSDADLCEKLTQVKGIGQWSSEMFLMFRMRRQDVFSPGDLILRQGTAQFVGKPKDAFRKTNKKTFEAASEIAANWSPYRSLASAYLWKSKDSRSASSSSGMEKLKK